jgi:hypothetical protein
MKLLWDDNFLNELNSRRPLDDDNPDGYNESDKDYVLNNIKLCVWMLDQLEFIKQEKLKQKE